MTEKFNLPDSRHHGDMSGADWSKGERNQRYKETKSMLMGFAYEDDEKLVLDTIFERLSEYWNGRPASEMAPEVVLSKDSETRSRQIDLRRRNVASFFEHQKAKHIEVRPRQAFNLPIDQTPGWAEWLKKEGAIKTAQQILLNELAILDPYKNINDNDMDRLIRQQNGSWDWLYSIQDLTWHAVFDKRFDEIITEILGETWKTGYEEPELVVVPIPDRDPIKFSGMPQSEVKMPAGTNPYGPWSPDNAKPNKK